MRILIISSLLALLPGLALAQGDCAAQAKTELEKIYCDVAATPEVRSLPSFSDFRRNPPKVQALLLKGPARKLGIDLPNANRASNPTPATASASPAEKPKPAPPVAKVDPPKVAQPKPVTPPPQPSSVSFLASCQFHGEQIQCPSRRYRLMNNQQNHQLGIGVLDASNRLSLPSFTGSVSNQAAVNNYLADSYETYIGKMLEIGLGGSTMTYTKFHYTFWDLHEKGEDFATRVGKMFEFLKQDKASMAVKSRYDNQLPGGMDWCQVLSETTIVCDNGKKNWVYRN